MFKRAKVRISSYRYSKAGLSVFAIVFAGLGVYLLVNSFATTINCTTSISPGTTDLVSAYSKLTAGQTLCLHGGAYSAYEIRTSNNGTVGSPITLASYPGERATITVNNFYILGGQTYHDFKNLNIVMSATSNQNVMIQDFSDNSIWQGNDISGINKKTCMELGYGSSVAHNTLIKNNRFHDCGNPANGNQDHAIYLSQSVGAIITENEFWNTAAFAIHLYPNADNSTITHNVIDSSGYGGVIFASDQIATGLTSDNNTVAYNMITNGSRYGMTTYWGSAGIGKGNVAHDNCNYGNANNTDGLSNVTLTNNVSATADPYNGSATRDYTLSGSNCAATVQYDAAAAVNAYFAAANGSSGGAYTTPTPTPTPTPAPTSTTLVSTTCPELATGKCRPYDNNSAWNVKVPANVTEDQKSATFINFLKSINVSPTSDNLPLTSDVTQYTVPVYLVDGTSASQVKASVYIGGYFGAYDKNDGSRVGLNGAAYVSGVPIPSTAISGAGSDGQITFWDPKAGVEYGFWQFYKAADGTYHATNGFKTHTTAGFYGRFSDGLAGRGAGTTYFSGLVRRWEIDQGKIEHALSFAYASPCCGDQSNITPKVWRYPAGKSDGAGNSTNSAVEGALFQIKPGISDDTIKNTWGCVKACFTIAKALQEYGMYSIDNSGSSKIYIEDDSTAKWSSAPAGSDAKYIGDQGRNLPSKIPWDAFRVVNSPCDLTASTCLNGVESASTTPAPDTPPTTTILTRPSSPTTATTATFTFSANEASTFKCKLDAGAYAACASPYNAPSPLSVGSHTFTAQATDVAGLVELMPPSATWTVSPPADTTPPTLSLTPANGATGLTGTVAITATATDTGGISHVDFFIDGSSTALSIDTSAPYTTNWNASVVNNGTHTIKAIAYDNASPANPTTVTNTVTVTNPDTIKPTAPTSLSATPASPTQVNLSWTASTDNIGVTGYYIQRNGVVIKDTLSTATTFTDSTAAASTAYTYNVVAYDAAKNPSPISNTATATTPAPPAPVDTTPPPAPTNLSAVLTPTTPNQVNLSWSAVTDPSGIKGYNIYRGTTKLNTALVTTTTYGDGTVAAGTSYSYTVSAVDGVNLEGAKSNTSSVTTPLPPPVSTVTTLSFNPTDDAFVNSRRGNRNYGKATSLVSENSPLKYSLYKFNVSGVGTRQIKSAKLRLYVNNGSRVGGALHQTNSNTWTQSTVTWKNKPFFNAANLSTLRKVTRNTWVETDVTSLVTNDGVYGILINSISGDTAGYASRETTTKPQLILGVQ